MLRFSFAGFSFAYFHAIVAFRLSPLPPFRRFLFSFAAFTLLRFRLYAFR